MKTKILKLMDLLEQSQYWTNDQMQQYQEDLLQGLVKHLYKHNVFFNRRMSAQGLTPNSIKTINGLKRLKPFTKSDIQQAGQLFSSTQIPRDHLPVSSAQTSGSTGEPIAIAKTNYNMLFWHANVMRDHIWWNRDLKSKLTSIRATISEYGEADQWGGPVTMLYGSGPAQGIPVNTDIKLQLELINKFQPNIMIVHAGILTAFVTEWERTGYTLTELKHIKNIGDMVSTDLRSRVKQLTGLHIEDVYSSSEVGAISVECPISGLHHIMSEHLIVEILDEQGRECKPGEIGRVVITDLFNTASPLIRYDLGDWAEVGVPCTCGRQLPTITRILGRTRNLLQRPDGSRFWPTVGQYKLGDLYKVRQWQVIQHSLTDVEYRIVTDTPLSAEQEQEIVKFLNQHLKFDNAIRITRYADRIPTPMGKFEETICLI
jgi:phenylacetate-CoA ligase